jgi:hypothetical protein
LSRRLDRHDYMSYNSQKWSGIIVVNSWPIIREWAVC